MRLLPECLEHVQNRADVAGAIVDYGDH
jgi:hypothetical protein